MKLIQMLIDPQGQIRLQTRGFSGATCRTASKALEEALGLVRSETPTAEMHQPATSQEATRQKAGGRD